VCALALAVALPAATVAAQTIRARADGLLEVTDAPPESVVRYTLDGTDPTRDAGVWLAPVDVPAGYTVKARAFTPDHTPVGTPLEWASRATGPRIASTLVPVTQGRDWRVYDWPARHTAAVALMQARQPEIVMLGDSIMHFWGGEPRGEHVGGRRTAPDVWDRFFTARRIVNLGYGWDRTENVLWRLRHGEFEHVSPKVVVLMIGTNNVAEHARRDRGRGFGHLRRDPPAVTREPHIAAGHLSPRREARCQPRRDRGSESAHCDVRGTRRRRDVSGHRRQVSRRRSVDFQGHHVRLPASHREGL
jgi:hypothetical protein